MKTEILTLSEKTRPQILKALNQGEVVALPTETVYGLAGNAFQEKALARIFEVKERPRFDPLILHLSDRVLKASSILEELHHQKLIQLNQVPKDHLTPLETLLRKYWPGPLTVIFPKHPRIPDLATSGLATVALRIPQHPVIQSILRDLSFPLAAPSANRFGRISPTEASHVFSELSGRIPWIVNGGKCDIGVESTVISVTEESPILYRPGAITQSTLESIWNRPFLIPSEKTKLVSPGLLKSHYAPIKKTYRFPESLGEIHVETLQNLSQGRLGFLLFEQSSEKIEWVKSHFPEAIIHFLDSDPSLAAQALFRCLRALDESPAQVLFVELPSHPDGLAYAIRDRLTRASIAIDF